MVILPLAAAAIHANAAIVLGVGNSFITPSGSGTVSSGAFFSQQLPTVGGITGLKFYGNWTTSATSSGGSGGSSACAFPGICAGLSVFGSVDPSNNTFDNDVFVTSFVFTLVSSNSDPVNWAVNTDLNTDGGLFSNSANGTTDPGGGNVSGSFQITGLQGRTLNSWEAFLEFDFNGAFTNGDTITIDLPQNSLDLTGLDPTPEPATWGFMAAGIAALALMRRRRS
jgi:hypothetical protein